MKKSLFLLFVGAALFGNAQSVTPFQRVYNTLNGKCQNSTCHSALSGDALKFDGDINAVYTAISEVNAENINSVNKHEKLIKAGHPYMSFLLRKVAGATFDTDLSIDANEGALMKDINGDALTNKEIEFIRQWVMFGAKKTYSSGEKKPDYQLVSDYYDDPSMPFLPKPVKPAAGEGLQYRMGPVFLPKTGDIEQEWLLQQEVNFPYLAQVERIEGFLNQQSHHLLLFKFDDAAAAVDRGNGVMGMERVVITGSSSFDGRKMLTSAWQDDADFILPTGTALFWDQTSYLDMNYHVKNYNATSVLPCDFYYNIYFKPRNPNTIEMKANLVNNVLLFLPQGVQTRDYDDQFNNDNIQETRYIWALTSHSHKYGTDYDIYARDVTGATTKLYEGFQDYANDFDKGYYDWEHPSTRYFSDLYPVEVGKHGSVNAGLFARTTWNVQQSFVSFGFTTADEMQLFYYFYTNQDPKTLNTGINDDKSKGISFQVLPNPMNNNGKLIYTLDNASQVSASIVDVTGKMVAQLSEESQQAGTHEVNVGTNEKLSSGIYFARLTVNGTVYSKKFVVTE